MLGGNRPDGQGQLPQLSVFEQLVFLSRCSAACGAIRAWKRTLLGHVARCIESNRDTWGDYGWHKAEFIHFATPNKRRRTDFHIKQQYVKAPHVLGETISAGQAAKAVSGIDKSQSFRWLQVETAALISATMLSFAKINGPVCPAIDMARLGNLAKEYLAGALPDPCGGRHAILYHPRSAVEGSMGSSIPWFSVFRDRG